jgi:hypothetical protein
VELDYAKYVEGQKVTVFNASEEKESEAFDAVRYKKSKWVF